MINKWAVYQKYSDLGQKKRLDKLRVWVKMRYGRNLNDYLDEMDFLIQEIERLEGEKK